MIFSAPCYKPLLHQFTSGEPVRQRAVTDADAVVNIDDRGPLERSQRKLRANESYIRKEQTRKEIWRAYRRILQDTEVLKSVDIDGSYFKCVYLQKKKKLLDVRKKRLA